MLNYLNKLYLNTKEFTFELFHPKGKFFRYSLAFFTAMFFKILLMDFPVFSKIIVNSEFSYKLSYVLVDFSTGFYNLINIPVIGNGRNLSIYNSVGVLVNGTCLGYRGFILFAVFILVYKGQFISKFIYVFLGFFVLESGNLVRVALLAYIQYCCPEKFEIYHFYLAKIIYYPIILFLWIIWIEKLSKRKIKFNNLLKQLF